MAEKNPLKYEAGEHLPFAAGDTLPGSVLNLAALVEAGTGVQIIDNGDGTLTLVNLCCTDAAPPPLSGFFFWTPNNLEVTFTAGVSGGTGPYTFAWDFGDGGTSTAANPVHTYAAAGPYTITLTVTDSLAVTAQAINVANVVAAPQSPEPVGVSFSWSTSGLTALFTALPYGGVTPYTYLWNFGDGNTSTEPAPSHTFASAGARSVSLTLTGAASSGTAAATNTVTVTVPGGGGSGGGGTGGGGGGGVSPPSAEQ